MLDGAPFTLLAPKCLVVCHRDVDGTCCLLDTLAAPKVSPKRQQDILSTLAFLTLGSEVNAGSVVASRGMATLVPLLGRRSEKTVISAARVIANLLASAPGQVGGTPGPVSLKEYLHP